jgi:hypothetical protein
MEDCRADAVGAVNSYLRQLKDDKDMEASVSLITFDSQSIDVIRDGVPAGSCAELGIDEFQPRSMTPLLDAVAHGVGVLDKRKEADARCVLAVMTDGLENASREHTKESVKALLDRKQKEEGWLVLYLGADHNAWEQAHGLGLRAGNVAAFDKGAMLASISSAGSRLKRYAMAKDAAKEAESGGFTDAERSGMRRSSRKKH